MLFVILFCALYLYGMLAMRAFFRLLGGPVGPGDWRFVWFNSLAWPVAVAAALLEMRRENQRRAANRSRAEVACPPPTEPPAEN